MGIALTDAFASHAIIVETVLAGDAGTDGARQNRVFLWIVLFRFVAVTVLIGLGVN